MRDEFPFRDESEGRKYLVGVLHRIWSGTARNLDAVLVCNVTWIPSRPRNMRRAVRAGCEWLRALETRITSHCGNECLMNYYERRFSA